MMHSVNDTITAIVSGFGGKSSSKTLQGMFDAKHGFSDVIVVDDHGEPGSSSEFIEIDRFRDASETMRMKNITRYPGSSPSRDFCGALDHVETPFFAISNVFRVPTNLRPIMDDDNRIMVPCLPADSQYCGDTCQVEAAGAAHFTAPPTPPVSYTHLTLPTILPV